MTDPDPNQNSTGMSAAESVRLVQQDKELRVPYYCEENVWRLAYKKMQESSNHYFYVCFISNENKSVAMYNQSAGKDNEGHLVCWDYHVILLGCSNEDGQALVYDIDCILPYPQPLHAYLRKSFCCSDDLTFAPPFSPKFRLVPAKLFLQHFSSDRMHMYDAKTCRWNAPPPPYHCIRPTPLPSDDRMGVVEDAWISLQQYLEFEPERYMQQMDSSRVVLKDAFGLMLSLEQLQEFDFEQGHHVA